MCDTAHVQKQSHKNHKIHKKTHMSMTHNIANVHTMCLIPNESVKTMDSLGFLALNGEALLSPKMNCIKIDPVICALPFSSCFEPPGPSSPRGCCQSQPAWSEICEVRFREGGQLGPVPIEGMVGGGRGGVGGKRGRVHNGYSATSSA